MYDLYCVNEIHLAIEKPKIWMFSRKGSQIFFPDFIVCTTTKQKELNVQVCCSHNYNTQSKHKCCRFVSALAKVVIKPAYLLGQKLSNVSRFFSHISTDFYIF